MKLLEKILAYLAQRIIVKYHPLVIGITGSVGKTSTKEAVFAALNETLSVRATLKSYNNQLGVPLTIIGRKAPGKNVVGWLRVFIHALVLLSGKRRYPSVLILEMGADRRGDIAYLTRIAPPHISIVTAVGEAHIEFFGSIGAIAEEKETLVRVLPSSGTAVLCADDPRVFAMRSVTKARVVTYGLLETADVRAGSVEYVRDVRTLAVQGLRINAQSGTSAVAFELMGVLGKGHVRGALAALAVARLTDMPLTAAAEGLKKYAPPPGRVRLIPGVKGSVLIDDTYNSSPDAALEAIATLHEYPVPDGAKRVALLGDMLELGGATEAAHMRVGETLARSGIDLFIGVGERMRDALASAKRAGLSVERTVYFPDAVSAARYTQDHIRSGDVVLIKGSQGMRMERAVKELMAEPERAQELLCRHDAEWVKK